MNSRRTAQAPTFRPPCRSLLRGCAAEPSTPVRRTRLQLVGESLSVEGDNEVYALTLRNTGRMTALFCEPHPLLEYRTDMLIDNNNCCIPPGESRVITIRAPARSPLPLGEGQGVRAFGGMTLGQTGWRISCWNAEHVIVEPTGDVLLSVGRRDKMCREYLGYFDASQVKGGADTVCTGNRPDSERLPYLLDHKGSARFEFNCDAARAGRRPLADSHGRPGEGNADRGGRLDQRPAMEAMLPRGLASARRSDALGLSGHRGIRYRRSAICRRQERH